MTWSGFPFNVEGRQPVADALTRRELDKKSARQIELAEERVPLEPHLAAANALIAIACELRLARLQGRTP
jgi:hypothetical protein